MKIKVSAVLCTLGVLLFVCLAGSAHAQAWGVYIGWRDSGRYLHHGGYYYNDGRYAIGIGYHRGCGGFGYYRDGLRRGCSRGYRNGYYTYRRGHTPRPFYRRRW